MIPGTYAVLDAYENGKYCIYYVGLIVIFVVIVYDHVTCTYQYCDDLIPVVVFRKNFRNIAN